MTRQQWGFGDNIAQQTKFHYLTNNSLMLHSKSREHSTPNSPEKEFSVCLTTSAQYMLILQRARYIREIESATNNGHLRS